MRKTACCLLLLGLAACHRRDSRAVEADEALAVDDAGERVEASADGSTDAIADAGGDAIGDVMDARKPATIHAPRLVRQTTTVHIGDRTETWSFVWRALPAPNCLDDFPLGPCMVEQFGEKGDADLVRVRADGTKDSFPLPRVALPRWPYRPKTDGGGLDVDPDEVQRRPEVNLFVFADYDHDGVGDLVVPVQYIAYGFYEAIAIGIDSKTDRLHALTTAEHPERPLQLNWNNWPNFVGLPEGERRSAVDVPCGDHLSEERVDLVYQWDAKGCTSRRVDTSARGAGRTTGSERSSRSSTCSDRADAIAEISRRLRDARTRP